jgi:hypothetical protein
VAEIDQYSRGSRPGNQPTIWDVPDFDDGKPGDYAAMVENLDTTKP